MRISIAFLLLGCAASEADPAAGTPIPDPAAESHGTIEYCLYSRSRPVQAWTAVPGGKQPPVPIFYEENITETYQSLENKSESWQFAVNPITRIAYLRKGSDFGRSVESLDSFSYLSWVTGLDETKTGVLGDVVAVLSNRKALIRIFFRGGDLLPDDSPLYRVASIDKLVLSQRPLKNIWGQFIPPILDSASKRPPEAEPPTTSAIW